VDRRLWVHAFDRYNVTQLRVRRGLWQLRRVGMGPRVVGDEVEMLAGRGGDAERLLHQAVLLVAVPVGPVALHLLVLIAAPSAVWSLAGPSTRRVGELAAATLALHLSICEKASGHSAGTPRLPIRPPPHAGLSLIPHEDRARPDGLALLL
jgi:hypothetical protein